MKWPIENHKLIERVIRVLLRFGFYLFPRRLQFLNWNFADDTETVRLVVRVAANANDIRFGTDKMRFSGLVDATHFVICLATCCFDATFVGGWTIQCTTVLWSIHIQTIRCTICETIQSKWKSWCFCFDFFFFLDYLSPEMLFIFSISRNSGWMVVEWMPSLWKNSLTFSAIFMYSDKLRHRMWADAMIRSPANCHTWNSWTANTPSTFSTKRFCMASTWNGRRSFFWDFDVWFGRSSTCEWIQILPEYVWAPFAIESMRFRVTMATPNSTSESLEQSTVLDPCRNDIPNRWAKQSMRSL